MTAPRFSGAASLVVAVVVALTGGGCPAEVTAVEVGRQLFSDPRLSGSEFNAFSCSTCHDDGSGEGGARIYPGHPLTDTVFRPTWWGGQSPTLADAVDECLVFFLREQPFATEPGDALRAQQGRALYEYLRSISANQNADALPLTIVENVTSVARGDPRRGEVVWTQACQSCHGTPNDGAGRLNEFVSLVPGSSEAFAAEIGFPVDVVIVEKVRHGPFFGVGGNMPPFSVESLSDEDLGALIAFLLRE